MSTPDNEENIRISIGERLRAERLRLGLSQEQLGNLCGVSTRSVASWESGAKFPSHKLALLAKHGMEVSFVISGEEHNAPCSADAQYRLTGGRATTTVLNEMLLRDVIEALEEALTGAGKTMRPSNKAQVIAALYNLYSDSENSVTVDKRAVLTLVKST